MARTIFKTEEPVVLEGYQAVMKPSKFGFSLSAIIGDDMVDQLETDRPASLAWAESKLKNPKRSTLKPEPWEEVAEGKYKIKFSWKEETNLSSLTLKVLRLRMRTFLSTAVAKSNWLSTRSPTS